MWHLVDVGPADVRDLSGYSRPLIHAPAASHAHRITIGDGRLHEPSKSQPSATGNGTVIITADSQFGSMLYDVSGQAIYLFDAERSTRPECYGECADDWPPVLTAGKPKAKEGVQSGLLGTTRRSDGATQVTYAGHPLYFYAHEGKYQVLCHNIEGYGGTWLVVQPDGDPAPH